MNESILSIHNVYVEGTQWWSNVKGKKFHPHCFTCARCNVSLANRKYYDHDGMPYCSDCDTQYFCPKCAWCGQVINRGGENKIQL